MATPGLELSDNLQRLNEGIQGLFTATQPKIDPAKVTPIFSKGILQKENLLGSLDLAQLTQMVSAQLNNAKTLMNTLGVDDITKAPAIKISSGLRVTPGYYHSSPGFTPNSVLPAKTSVIIASSLDLTNTTLVIDPSVSTLTLIVETLTCGTGAQITYDDSLVWRPLALPQTTAINGVSYNPNAYGGGATNGPNGGNGTPGKAGNAVVIVPPAAPNIVIYALNIDNLPAVNIAGLKGAPGNPGQNGGNGGNGGRGKNGSDIWPVGCTSQPGSGGTGGDGGRGGDGGAGGEGGAGGDFSVLTLQANWEALVNKKTWTIYNGGGPGGNPGLPGTGGTGGQGGVPGTPGGAGMCKKLPVSPNGARGANGNSGSDGKPGNGGTITPAVITQEEWEEELTLPWLQTINPGEGYAGTIVNGVGLNFGTGDSVLVNGEAVSAAFPAAGEFNITLPNTLSGGSNTIAVQRAEDNKVSNSMTFTVQPFISGSTPSDGYTPGDLITVTGTGFLDNASLHLTQPGQASQILVPTKTSATSIEFQVPGVTESSTQAQGEASLVVVNPDGLSSNTVQITRLSFAANGFLPSVHGFQFTNLSACPGSPSPGTFAADFGAGEVAFSLFLNPVLTAAYYALYAVLLGPECQGLCTGLACGAMDRFTAGFGNTYVAFPVCTPALKSEFTVDWGRQLSGELLSHLFAQSLNGDAQVLSSIQQVENTFILGATRDNMPLVYFIPSGAPIHVRWFKDSMASHTIVPFKLVRPLGWAGGYDGVKLYIYDCNSPNQDDCYITFKQTGTVVTFDYDHSHAGYNPDYSSANGFTLGVATMDQALYKGVDLPWMTGDGWILEFVLSPVSLTVSNLAGQVTGQVGDLLVTQVPGVIPSFVTGSHNMVLIPRQLALQRTIEGTDTGSYTYVSIAPPNPSTPTSAFDSLRPPDANSVVPRERGFSLHNIPCSATTKDVILMAPDNQSIQISTSDSSKTFDVLIAQRYDVQSGAAPQIRTAQMMQSVQIEGLTLKMGEELLLWTDAALGQIGISNSGGAKSFELTVSTADPETGKTLASQQLAATVEENGDFVASVDNWQQLSKPTPKNATSGALLPADFKKPIVQ